MDNNDNQNGGFSDNTWQGGVQQQDASQKPVVVNELANKKDSMVIASLVLGILGIVFCWTYCVPIILGLIGLIMGIVGMVKTKEHRGIALAGIITSCIGLVLGFLLNCLYLLLMD